MASDESLLDRIRKRTGLYLGKNCLTALRHFLFGYHCALDNHSIPRSTDPNVLPHDFHDLVAYRLHFKESTSGWCNMISSRVESEDAALDRFFTLLDDYRARKPHVVARLVGIRRSYSVTRRDVTQTIQYPPSISLVTYTDDPGFFVRSDTDDELPGPEFYPDIDWFETSIAKRDRLTIVDRDWNYGLGRKN